MLFHNPRDRRLDDPCADTSFMSNRLATALGRRARSTAGVALSCPAGRSAPGALHRNLSVSGTLALCLVLMFLAAGCQDDPYARLCTTEKPQTNDVVGRYTLKDQTIVLGGAEAMKGRPCVVELAADGTFTATNVPPFSPGSPPINSLKLLVSGSGTWRLESVGAVDDGSGQLKTHWGVRLDSVAPKLDAPGLTSNQPPYGLIYSIGDPDSGTVMLFERAN